jgi:hypothetical protein
VALIPWRVPGARGPFTVVNIEFSSKFRQQYTSQFGIGQTFSYNLAHGKVKAITVIHIRPVIVPECLLVRVAG